MRCGHSRCVVLTKRLAFKFPILGSWKGFLLGLLGNMSEKEWTGGDNTSKLCPIYFSVWGGFLNICPRCDEITRKDWFAFDYDNFIKFGDNNQYKFPIEEKMDSFGMLNNKIVAIDFAS